MANYLTTTSIAIGAGTLVGKMIVDAFMQDDSLFLEFENGLKIEVFDDGQECCERRHMSTDDDVESMVGCWLIHVDGRYGGDIDDRQNVHEICFVEIQTDRGLITIANHNEHNGYYGGFKMMIRQIDRLPQREAA